MGYRLLIFNMYCDEYKPYPEFLEGARWVEKNSKFDIFYQQLKDSPLKKNERIEDETGVDIIIGGPPKVAYVAVTKFLN